MQFPEAIIEQLNPPSSYRHIPNPELLHAIQRKDNYQHLTVLGSYHNTDPAHWCYDGAFYFFDDWRESTEGKKRIVIAEGEQDLWGLAPTLRQSIEQYYSEVGWQCYVADSYDIPIISGEPPNYGEIPQLIHEGQYSPSELLLYYGIREIPLWHRMSDNKEDFDTYMQKVFAIYQRKLGRLAITHSLDELDFTYSRFQEDYKRHFNAEPDPQSPEMNELHLKYTSAEMAEDEFSAQPIARVAKRVMELRNAHLGAVYDDHLKNGESVFSWYGMYHTLALAKYVRHFGKPSDIPKEVVEQYTWQDGVIIDGIRTHPLGPDGVQAAIKNEL